MLQIKREASVFLGSSLGLRPVLILTRFGLLLLLVGLLLLALVLILLAAFVSHGLILSRTTYRDQRFGPHRIKHANVLPS